MSFIKELSRRKEERLQAEQASIHDQENWKKQREIEEAKDANEAIEWFKTTNLHRQISETLNNPDLTQFLLYVLHAYSKKDLVSFFTNLFRYGKPKIYHEIKYSGSKQGVYVQVEMYVVLKNSHKKDKQGRYGITMRTSLKRDDTDYESGRIEFQIPLVDDSNTGETKEFVSIEALTEFALRDLSNEESSSIARATYFIIR